MLALEYGYFYPSSDSYGFGMLLWEMATRGAKPFEGEQGDPREAVLFKKRRPAVSPQWDLAFRVLMWWCWEQQPERRPAVHHIWAVLSEYRKQVVAKDPNVNDPDEVLRVLMRSVAASVDGAPLPDFPQMQGMIDSFLRCKKEGDDNNTSNKEKEDEVAEEGRGGNDGLSASERMKVASYTLPGSPWNN